MRALHRCEFYGTEKMNTGENLREWHHIYPTPFFQFRVDHLKYLDHLERLIPMELKLNHLLSDFEV